MKKALIICIIIFIVSAVAFGISVAATGLSGDGFGVSVSGIPFLGTGDFFGFATKSGDVISKNFNQTVNDIEIITSIAETTVTTDDVSEISVYYETETGGYRFSADVKNDKLIVKEEGGFLIRIFSFSDHESTLEIVLPEKEYGDVNIVTASGSVEITDLVCENFDSVTASGNSDYSIFASDMNLTTTSGCVTVENCTDRKAEKISLDSVSGTHSVSGFLTEEFKLNSVSGSIEVEDISGKGSADIVSGDVTITYAEWDNNLTLNAVSGEYNIILPDESGVVVELDAVSGSVEVELWDDEGETVSATLTGGSTSGKIGGSNVNNVKIDLVSGDVNISN